MEYEDVKERLTGMTSGVSLPSDRKAAIWANIRTEIVKHEQQSVTRKKRGLWYRNFSVCAAVACVAAVATFVYLDKSKEPFSGHDSGLANVQNSSVVLQFAGQDSTWLGILSQASQNQKEVDYIDLTYRGTGSLDGQQVTCEVIGPSGRPAVSQSGVIKGNKVRIAFASPIQLADQNFTSVTDIKYPVRVTWAGHSEQLNFTYSQGYTR